MARHEFVVSAKDDAGPFTEMDEIGYRLSLGGARKFKAYLKKKPGYKRASITHRTYNPGRRRIRYLIHEDGTWQKIEPR